MGGDEVPCAKIVVDRRRKTGILLAAWTIFFFEVGLAVVSYADLEDFAPPMAAITIAVLGFTLIDFFARPEKREYSSTLSPRWYRGYLPFWCLVPFITALGGSVWVHYQKWSDARTDIRQLAREVKAAVEWPDEGNAPTGTRPDPKAAPVDAVSTVAEQRGWFATDGATEKCWQSAHRRNAELRSDPHMKAFDVLGLYISADRVKRIVDDLGVPRTWRCFTTERVNAKVATLVSTRYGTDKDTPEAKRFAEIARVVGHDVLIAHGDIRVVCANIAIDTGASFALALAIQALFILWIPALLAVTISRAQKRTKRLDGRLQVQHSIDLRDHRIMAEDEYLFLPRMCFAILLVLGTNYVFAPLGLKATYIMSIVDEHALPGHTTFILWSTAFSQAPVIVVGFVGFLIYALITATQRFALDDFDDKSLLALLVRGLVVILLSFALSSSDINEVASRTFVFFAGVFPIRALESIAKRFNTSIDPDIAPTPDPCFVGLPGLDPTKVFALRAAGIQSTYDLAAMNIEDVAERVRIDPRLLGRAVDRAILIDAIGSKLAETLATYGITSATELVATTDLDALIVHGSPAPPDDVVVLARVAKLVQRRLTGDPRIDSVKGWIATKPTPDANVSG